MRSYQSGQAANVPVSLTDPVTGSTLSPEQARWRLLDANDAVLIDWTVVADPASLSDIFLAPVPAEHMTLGTSEGHISGRALHLEVTDAEGPVVLVEHFLLVSDTSARLIPNTNSFQTYTQAMVVASQMPGVTLGAMRDESTAAMIEAWQRITALKFRTGGISGLNLRELTLDEWWALPVDMRVALCRGQVREAVAILEGDEVAEARARGIISQTVGESSQFFGSTRPLDMGVTPATLKEVGRWVDHSIRIARA